MPEAASDFDDPRIDEGISLFNQREFFACHDVLEDYWNDLVCPERKFFQGLIQAAVALFHFEEGNLGGALRMFRSASMYLAPWRPVCARIDVDDFLQQLELCFAELDQPHSAYPTHIRLDASRIPVVRRVQ